MIWLVGAEAAAIVVLGLFVVALAHSYAGLAARLEQRGAEGARDPSEGRPPRARARSIGEQSSKALHIVGVSPSGDDVALPIAGVVQDTLLAFLSSTCRSCEHLWRELQDGPQGLLPDAMRLVIVPKGPDRESPSAIASLAPPGCDVVMSSAAWSDFDIPGSPYFVLVEGGSGEVAGEGTGLSWSQVVELMGVSSGDAAITDAERRTTRKPRRDRQHEEEIDRLLMDAGILPGDPSLYPAVGDGADA